MFGEELKKVTGCFFLLNNDTLCTLRPGTCIEKVNSDFMLALKKVIAGTKGWGKSQLLISLGASGMCKSKVAGLF